MRKQIKRKSHITLLCLFILFVYSSIPVYSTNEDYVELKMISAKCTNQGRLILEVMNKKPAILSTDEIIINVSGNPRHLTVSGNIINIEDLKGSWSREKIYSYEYIADFSKAYANFTSEKGQLSLKGDYIIYVKYPNCINKPEYCVETINLDDCPGYWYDCELTNITITDCYTQGGFFHFIFKGLNKGQDQELSPETDVTYEFIGPNRIWAPGSTPEGFEVGPMGYDRFMGKFPVQEQDNITTVGVYVNICNTEQSRAIKKDCGMIEVCKSDKNCPEDMTCENSKCVPLQCGVCQEAKNHQCVNRCDDDNPCTEDGCDEVNDECYHNLIENCCATDEDCEDDLVCTVDKCVNNKCVRIELKCEAEDPCIIGSCIEPEGCKYQNNYTCIKQQMGEESFLKRITGGVIAGLESPNRLIGPTIVVIVLLLGVVAFAIYRRSRYEPF